MWTSRIAAFARFPSVVQILRHRSENRGRLEGYVAYHSATLISQFYQYV